MAARSSIEGRPRLVRATGGQRNVALPADSRPLSHSNSPPHRRGLPSQTVGALLIGDGWRVHVVSLGWRGVKSHDRAHALRPSHLSQSVSSPQTRVDGRGNPTAAWHRILTPWSGLLALAEPGDRRDVVCAGLDTDSAAASGGGFADQVDRSGAGVSKNTVKAAWASDGPLKCERVQRGSIVNEMEPPIRELLKAYPQMPATVIAERIGWPTPNSGIDLSTLGATLDVRVNGGIHIRLREALGPIRGLPSIPSPRPIADLWSVLGR